MKLSGHTLSTLARIAGTGKEHFDFVGIVGRTLRGFLRGAGNGYVQLTLPDSAEPFDGDAAIPIPYLKRMAKITGRSGVAAFSPVGTEPRANLSVLVGKTTYRTSVDPGSQNTPCFPARPEPDAVRARADVAPADFTKGGAIAVAAGYASTDESRPQFHAVHLDALVTASNGYQITRRRPVSELAGFDTLVPLALVEALVKVAQRPKLAPTSIRVVKYDRARAEGDPDRRVRVQILAPDGEWLFDVSLGEAVVPAYDEAAPAEREGERLVAVNAGDFRAMYVPFRRSPKVTVAIYPAGLLSWGDWDESGIGTTLDAFPEGLPLAMLGAATLGRLAEALPEDGDVTFGIVAPEQGVRFGGDIYMPMKIDVPERVIADLTATVGAIVSTPAALPTAADNDNAKAA